MSKMTVIQLLNKIANDELKENTKFYDKYDNKTYIYKPKSYNGIYREGKAYANENWYLTLNGSSKLLDEVEIIEDTSEDKKIEKLKQKRRYIREPGDLSGIGEVEYYYDNNELGDKINEIIDKIKGEENE